MRPIGEADQLSPYGSRIVRRTDTMPSAPLNLASSSPMETRVRSPVDGFVLAVTISVLMWAALAALGWYLRSIL